MLSLEGIFHLTMTACSRADVYHRIYSSSTSGREEDSRTSAHVSLSGGELETRDSVSSTPSNSSFFSSGSPRSPSSSSSPRIADTSPRLKEHDTRSWIRFDLENISNKNDVFAVGGKNERLEPTFSLPVICNGMDFLVLPGHREYGLEWIVLIAGANRFLYRYSLAWDVEKVRFFLSPVDELHCGSQLVSIVRLTPLLDPDLLQSIELLCPSIQEVVAVGQASTGISIVACGQVFYDTFLGVCS